MRVLVAGIGNVFLGDDGFGVEVARRLMREPVPPSVTVVDVGIRALHLAYELLDPPELLLIVDAVSRGQPPGTLYLIDVDAAGEPDIDADAEVDACIVRGMLGNAHGITVSSVLATLRALGGTPPRTRLVGCEPAFVGAAMELSPVVAASVPRALTMVREAMREERRDETHRTASAQPEA
jgi:hydrogenase maturation protease